MSDAAPRGCVGFLFRLFGWSQKKTGSAEKLPQVQISKFFVTNAEADFFRVLQKLVGTRGHVLAQVSLRQLLYFPGNNQTNPGRATWQNKVASRSVDFIVCDPSTLRPKVIIELDEPSHSQPERQTRDEEVEAICKAAGLAVVRVLTSRSYNTRELEHALAEYLA